MKNSSRRSWLDRQQNKHHHYSVPLTAHIFSNHSCQTPNYPMSWYTHPFHIPANLFDFAMENVFRIYSFRLYRAFRLERPRSSVFDSRLCTVVAHLRFFFRMSYLYLPPSKHPTHLLTGSLDKSTKWSRWGSVDCIGHSFDFEIRLLLVRTACVGTFHTLPISIPACSRVDVSSRTA